MPSKTSYILFFGLVFICLSCEENREQVKPEIVEENWDNVEIPNTPSVQLTPEAKTETSKWLAFVTAQSEVMDYRKNNVGYAAENAPATLQIMQKLQETIPEKFKIPPVESRITVLVTLAHTLNQESAHREPDREKIAEITKKIPAAFDHLKIQLNEVFAESLEDFQEKLKINPNSLSDSIPTFQ